MVLRVATALCFLGLCVAVSSISAAEPPPISVGVAKVDITPEYPVRLSGYGSRRTESEGVAQRLWAKALAIGDQQHGGPAVLITVENCGVPGSMADEVCQRLESLRLRREQLVVSSSHSHSAPWLPGFAPFLAGEPVPAEHQQRMQQYRQELTDKMVQAASQALQNRQPARLAWAQGRVAFAANRRVLKDGVWVGFGVQANGPVDERLPVLVAKDVAGKPLAIVANYACHCTTLGGDFNQICGDWSGFAQEDIEHDFAGAVALLTIGCGADANPEPRGKLEFCRQHGRALADEVQRLLGGELKPVSGEPACRLTHVDLPLGPLPSRADWETAAAGGGSNGMRAKHFLGLLDRGKALPAGVRYPIATWTFADDLAIVFLGGEVVVDYAQRLSRECDAKRLWITAYANDVPCYIASQRILREGGYEADSSMIYYGQPTRLAPETEDLIVGEVRRLLPAGYVAKP
jgi:hypothetical protein